MYVGELLQCSYVNVIVIIEILVNNSESLALINNNAECLMYVVAVDIYGSPSWLCL